MSDHVLRGKGKPFPYIEMLRIRRTWRLTLVLLRGVGDAAPYNEMLRIRLGFVENRVLLRGAPGSARPTRKRCGFAGRFCLSLVLLRGRRGRRPLQSALTHSLPQRGRVPPSRAAGEGERGGTAMWK